MRLPRLGRLSTLCPRCDRYDADTNVVVSFIHDLRCWSVSTALFNLRARLAPPAWF